MNKTEKSVSFSHDPICKSNDPTWTPCALDLVPKGPYNCRWAFCTHTLILKGSLAVFSDQRFA